FTFVGYFINMLAIPALALAGNWPLAAGLIVAERAGRGFRKPPVDGMLSDAGKSLGAGWVFGLNEALDQLGATIGPLIAALVLYLKHGYHLAFAVFLIPALLCLATLAVARFVQPRPHELVADTTESTPATHFSNAYWIYLVAGALIAAGFADFSLVAFHFQKTRVVQTDVIPIFYAAAMATGALSSL